MNETSVMMKDDVFIARAQKRLLRAYQKAGTWRQVSMDLGVNHGNLVDLAKNGHIPADAELRSRLGLPRVMPSERKPRARKVIPLLGSPCWKCMAFKTIKPKRRKL